MGSVGKKIEKTVSKARDKTKAEMKRVSGEELFSLGTSTVFDKVKDKTGVDFSLFTPTGLVTKASGEVGRYLIDKPKEAQAAAAKLDAEQSAANQKALADIDRQDKQMGAEKKAGKALSRGRSKQSRKARGGGRRSTILTNKLGGTGGEEGRKSLLGL